MGKLPETRPSAARQILEDVDLSTVFSITGMQWAYHMLLHCYRGNEQMYKTRDPWSHAHK
jgi:hypothetical protein